MKSGLNQDKRIVLTLDAGGTNFVFSAFQANKEIVIPYRQPSNAHQLDLCLETIVNGFKTVIKQLPQEPSAISFAFPGPADYPKGIIGELGNLPAFTGDVPLGPFLEEIFKIPVYINNDGDLFAYGEYISGFLPYVNQQLKDAGSPKQYKNLLGITLGTGFGAGIVSKGELFIGDNSNAAEIWLLRNKLFSNCFAEEGISIRAIVNYYNSNATGTIPADISPKLVYDIAKGTTAGDKKAAHDAFYQMAEILADALASAATLIDGLIVIGGGLSASYELWIEPLLNEMNGTIQSYSSEKITRLGQKIYDLQNSKQFTQFLTGNKKEISIPGTQKTIIYDPEKRLGIGLSKLGTSEAISLGAYAFAINELDR